MRNLKRALSLTLASVMLLGMMVVGTSAASFPDVTAEDNVEAIEVLSAVGVLQGYDDGQYHADTPVTRNQMATIICRMMGWRDSDFAGVNPFPDVPDWAANYVAACVANGIVNGRDDGRFHGDDTVTATEAASMMLRALGYTRMPVGAEWARAVTQQASRINLFDSLNVGANAAMVRGDIAQLALNTLESTLVDVEDNTLNISGGTNDNPFNISGGQIKYVVRTAANNSTMATAIKSNVNYGGGIDGTSGETVELGEHVFNGDLKKSVSFDKFGAPSSRWTYKSREVGTYADSTALTYTKEVKIKDIYQDLGLSTPVPANYVTFRIDGAREGTGTTGDIQTNGNNPKYLYNVTLTDNDASGQDGAEKIGGKGSVTNVYYKYVPATAAVGASPAVAAHDEVTITVTNYYLAQATEDYDSSNKELDVELKSAVSALTSNTLKLEDFPVISGVKENDYLVLTIVGGEAQSVAMAEVVGNVTVSSSRANDYVTAGQKYEYNDVAKADSSAVGQEFMDGSSDYKLNDTEYNLYLDPKGYVLGVEAANGETSVDDYLFVTDWENLRLEHIGEAVFSDGTKKTITITKLDGEGTFTWNASCANKFYSFRTNKDGNYELESVRTSSDSKNAWQSSQASAYLDDQARPIRDAASNSNPAVNYSANANTVFVAKDKAYVGVKNAPETKDPSTIYFLMDKKDRLVFVYTGQKGSNSAKAEDLVYILNNNPAVTKDGNDTFHLYTAIVEGEKTTDFAVTKYATTREPGLYEISTYTDGRADLPAAPITDLNDYSELADYLGAIGSADFRGGTLRLGSHAYLLADGVKIRTIDGNTVKAVSASGVKGAVEDGFKYVYVVETSSTNSDLSAVYLSKKAPAGAGASDVPSGSGNDAITDKLDEQDSVTANNASLTETLEVPKNKETTFTGTLKGTVTSEAGGGSGNEDGKVTLDNVTVEPNEEVDLSGATNVEFKGTTTIPEGSTLKLPSSGLTELPKLAGEGVVTVNNNIAVPAGTTDEILGELQDSLGLKSETMPAGVTGDGGKKTYTITPSKAISFTPNSNSVGCYSSENLSTVAGYCGATGTATVSFHQITLTEAMMDDFNTVKISYKIGADGAATAYNAAVFGGGSGSSLTDYGPGHVDLTTEDLDIILPVASDATAIIVELSYAAPAPGGGE